MPRIFWIFAVCAAMGGAVAGALGGCSDDDSGAATADGGGGASSSTSSGGSTSSSGGSSSGSSTSSTSSSGGSSSGGLDASVDDSSPGTIACGAAACDASDGIGCCLNGGSATCIAYGGPCDGGWRELCDEAADCQAGFHCCWGFFPGPSAVCHSGACPVNRAQACRTSAECDGGTCAVVSCPSSGATYVVQTCNGVCP